MLLSANTKAVGYAGIASFVLGLLCYGPFQSALNSAFPSLGTYLTLVFIVAGFAASYFGMPATVPTTPTPTETTK